MANPYPANFETLEGGGRLTGQVNFTDPANQPGGSQPVSCRLLTASTDVSATASVPLLWNALEDNAWDENPLVAIPAGLGLGFAFDGSSNLLTALVSGTWALSLSLLGGSWDAAWRGFYDDGLWGQSDLAPSGGSLGPHFMAASVMALPSGAQLAPAITTGTPAALAQSLVADLLVTRLA